MFITFDAIGLSFEAVVKYLPGEESSFDDPGYPSECGIVLLKVRMVGFFGYNLHDAIFLLQSDVGDQIQDAAHEAADAMWPIHKAEAKAEAAIDRAEARKDWSAA